MAFLFPTRRAGLALALAAAAALVGCSTTDGDGRLLGLITPYRPDLVQGNVVTRDQLAQLKVGQSADQVRDLLGAPLLTDGFHANRWDYVFLMRRQGTEPQLRSLVVLFDKARVVKVEAPELPSENEFVSAISTRPVSTREVKLALTAEERAALPAPPARAAAAAANAPQGAARSYPPLEAAP